MKALQSLTDLFKKHIVDAKNFAVWAEDGALFCGQDEFVDGFEIEYTAIVYMQDVKVQPHILMMHLVSWLNTYDPYRQEKGLAFPSFATELLDKGHCDIKIKIDLRESFSLEESPQGDWKQDGERYECVSEFQARANEDDLGELILFVGHLDDLP
ncbi:phage tail protein [Vibrio plantisponsor]|uniref:Phage tail protein n=1 Tax=Vibrio plantisponsor TaxID=664643 RepID=A0ABU4INY4_9VIBR|nr:phage tail protein [Vibrio plantisponsor]MDW6019943.1 phage tail protein [Vibrio plantisponsor]NNM42640.1 phage tail protein [Vibrio plantisponsor]